MPDSSHLNDRSGELRCTAKNLSLHLRENAASAKVENPRSVLSAQRTSIQTAANYRFPEGFSMRAAARRLLLDRCRPALTNLGRRKLRGAWWDLWGKH